MTRKSPPAHQPQPAAVDLAGMFAKMTIGEPVSWRGLQVFPLLHPNGHAPSYTLLEDLLGGGEVEITEVGDGGEVPTVVVKNRSATDALILDGMELHGAKQNRMVNVTIVVGKHSDTAIPVSCVEQGRWSYRAGSFRSAGRTVGHKLRSRKAQMVCESLARERGAATDQGRVWDEVEEYVEAAKVVSPTRALDDAFTQREDSIRGCVNALSGIDGFGAVVALNGKIVGFDLLDSRATFGKLWQMLLRGYAMDAVLDAESGEKSMSRERVEAWLRTVAEQANVTAHEEVPGVGEYHAVRGPRVAGGVTLLAGQAVHVALFPDGGT